MGRVSGFSVEIVMSHSAETFSRENLLCCVKIFRKFPVAKKFMGKRGGGINSFRRKFFCLTVPKRFVWAYGNPLVFH